MSSSDLALVGCAQEGDAGAFDFLVLRYRHELLKLIRRHVDDAAQAEAIARETFRTAYRALSGFPHKTLFFTWLSRIAIDTAAHAPVANPKLPQSAVETPGRLALTDEVRETVRSTIERLPRDLRTALLLREQEGLTYEQIGEVLGCPARTARTFIFLARTAIDERISRLA